MLPTPVFLGFPGGSAGKESAGFDPWVGKIPWRRESLPTPVFWPGESQRVGHDGATFTLTLSLCTLEVLY